MDWHFCILVACTIHFNAQEHDNSKSILNIWGNSIMLEICSQKCVYFFFGVE